MEAKFWLDKWAADQIGFHEEMIHPMLLRHWEGLNLGSAAKIFVPLCGKSKDLIWLREQGCKVIGVELSAIAAQACFEENGLTIERDRLGKFDRYHCEGLTILCGDFFDLDAHLLGPISAIYDRAALIALPVDSRRAYVDRLRHLCDPGVAILLITLDYPTQEISPPPFLVSDTEVMDLYTPWSSVKSLSVQAAQVKGLAGRETAFQIVVA